MSLTRLRGIGLRCISADRSCQWSSTSTPRRSPTILSGDGRPSVPDTFPFPQWSRTVILNLLPPPLLSQHLTSDPPHTLFQMLSLHLRRSSGSLDYLSDSPSSFPQRKIGTLLFPRANVLRSHSTLWSAVHLTFRNEGMTMDEEVRIALSGLVRLA
ncbi:hypothetical protein GYMLUDRAFT_241046 [Collybiopsis luxurians FD-317 M1]|nr:hypothetical protein GYMLUDRAFT_241046 [Collybiopsis luxurians FD-317 M1]